MADTTDRDNVIILRGQVAMLQAQVKAMTRNVSETRRLYKEAQAELRRLKGQPALTDRDDERIYHVVVE